jgi:hypothetical protein
VLPNATPDTTPESGERYVLLSSTGTLFWRVFVPIFCTGILTLCTLAVWLMDQETLYLSYPLLYLRIGLTLGWLGWLYFVRRTLWRLLRVDANSTHLVVTNYWTPARYAWSDVERVTESKHLGRRVAHIHLRGTGRYGQKISFLPTADYRAWLDERGIG